MKQKIWVRQLEKNVFIAFLDEECKKVISGSGSTTEYKCIEKAKEQLTFHPTNAKPIIIDTDDEPETCVCGEEVKDSTVPCPECQQAKAEMREDR